MQGQFFSEQNRYEIVHLLGKGATGEVYLVREYNSMQIYAMKICEDRELLRQESELLQKLKHPMFPAWKDYFEEKQGYLIMEYIEGITLQKYMEGTGKMVLTLAQKIILDILGVLDFLHHQIPQIIYRDLKPENIMISSTGKIKLIDLGGAIDSKYKVGTYGYGAPEQFWEGTIPGPECDLYAAGKLLAFLLTGKDPCQPPYDMLRFCEKNKFISPEIYRVLQRSLAVESLGRYASAGEFIRDIQEAVRISQSKKWKKSSQKQQNVYEKCIWKSEYQRIF